MNEIPQQFQIFIDDIVNAAREMICEHDELPPTAFLLILSEGGGKAIPLMLDASNGATKDFSARMIRKLAQLSGADGVLLVMEMWTLAPEAAKQFYEETGGNGSIADRPDRISGLLFQLETAHGVWIAMPPITGEGRERVIDEVKFEFMHKCEGRFASLLPQHGVVH